ncbi:AbgT family transporter [Rothia kristinae]|nr:AbgT family transporter [Rothia kristinae]
MADTDTDTAQTAPTRGAGDRLLTAVEKLGNKLPEPFTLFIILFLITGAISTVMALSGAEVTMPGSDEKLAIKGLFTGEGIAWFTSTIGENYIGFPPLVTVATILLGIGIADKTGFLSTAIRLGIGNAPRWLLPYAVAFVGVSASIMADSSFLVVPPLAALAFKAVGRHPVAGLLGGFAAVNAGFSTAVLPTTLDALFAGITNAVMPNVPQVAQTATTVTPLSNYWFNIASSLVLTVICGWLIDKVLEPRLNRQQVPQEESGDPVDPAQPTTRQMRAVGGEDAFVPADQFDQTGPVTAQEKKGLVWGAVALAVVGIAMIVFALLPASPWRNDDGGFLPKSPLMDSLVFIIFALFAVGGYVYGRVAGVVRGLKDVPTIMGLALKDLIPFLVIAFVLGQFVALFNWSGIGSWTAVKLATGLQDAGITGFPIVVLFILLCSLLNLFITSGSGMWTLMAAVFVPMFGLLGYEPAFVQAAFRIGDSATQVVTPLSPYLVIILTMLRKYEPKAGLGTVMARLVPFAILFWIGWFIVLCVFYFFDLPLGPGAGIMIGG